MLICAVAVWSPAGCGGSTAGVEFLGPRQAALGSLFFGSRLLAGVMGAVQLEYDEATGKILRIPVEKDRILPSLSPLNFAKQAAAKKCVPCLNSPHLLVAASSLKVFRRAVLPSFTVRTCVTCRSFDEQTTDHQSAVAYVHELHHGGEGSGPVWTGLVWCGPPRATHR